jgi:hypothetical protein
LDTPEHVDTENINLKIGNGSSLYQLFSKRDFLLHKLWLKLAKLTKNEIFGFFFKSPIFECNYSKAVRDVFHDLKNVKIAEKSLKIGQFLPILATVYEFKSRFEKSW